MAINWDDPRNKRPYPQSSAIGYPAPPPPLTPTGGVSSGSVSPVKFQPFGSAPAPAPAPPSAQSSSSGPAPFPPAPAAAAPSAPTPAPGKTPPPNNVYEPPPPNQIPAPPPAPPPDPSHTQPSDYEPEITWLMQNVDSTVGHDQWWQWIKMGLYNPTTHKFRSENVDQNGNPISGEFEKPVDCPDGTTKYGSNTCLPLSDPRVGGNGGGGGGGNNGGGGAGGNNPNEITDHANELWKEIMGLQSRYSPEVMQRLIGGAKSRGAAAGKRAGEAANLDAIRRGLGRSGDAAISAEQASRGAESDIVNPAVVGYTQEKIKADAEDRINKLTAMQNWINSARQHIQAMTATAAQKEVALANLALMEKRLQQELLMQQNQFDFNMAYGAQSNLGY